MASEMTEFHKAYLLFLRQGAAQQLHFFKSTNLA
jgi:hypothetical protein